MRIVTFTKIKKFIEDYPDSDIALKDWYLRTKRSEWNNLSDINQTFNSVDYVWNNRYIELNILSDLVADYEETNYPIASPNLIDVIKLRMYEHGLTQKKLSEILGVSTSRVSEYLTGKSEPTLKVARNISLKLDIDPKIVLGT